MMLVDKVGQVVAVGHDVKTLEQQAQKLLQAPEQTAGR